jgi:hypothetical protein
VLNRSRLRRSAAHWASTMPVAGVCEAPIARTLPAADQVGQRGEGFLDAGAGVGAVELAEVDVVGLQAAQ